MIPDVAMNILLIEDIILGSLLITMVVCHLIEEYKEKKGKRK